MPLKSMRRHRVAHEQEKCLLIGSNVGRYVTSRSPVMRKRDSAELCLAVPVNFIMIFKPLNGRVSHVDRLHHGWAVQEETQA